LVDCVGSSFVALLWPVQTRRKEDHCQQNEMVERAKQRLTEYRGLGFAKLRRRPERLGMEVLTTPLPCHLATAPPLRVWVLPSHVKPARLRG